MHGFTPPGNPVSGGAPTPSEAVFPIKVRLHVHQSI